MGYEIIRDREAKTTKIVISGYAEVLSGMSGLSTVLRKTTLNLILMVDIYFDTSKCPLRGD